MPMPPPAGLQTKCSAPSSSHAAARVVSVPSKSVTSQAWKLPPSAFATSSPLAQLYGALGVAGVSILSSEGELQGTLDFAITYSSTGRPPIRCSWMMRSRTFGLHARYQTPSG